MPKDARLEPVPIKSREAKGQAHWMLSIPPRLSDNHKRVQKFYPTKKEAETAAEQVKARRENFGRSANALSLEKAGEAKEAFRLIEEKLPSLSLLQIVKERVLLESKRVKSLQFGEVFDQYIKARKTKTLDHRDKLRNCKKRFRDHHETLVCDLTHHDFEPTLDKLTPRMRNAQMRYLRSVLNFGIKRGYLDHNPLDRLDFADIENGEVEIIPLPIVERMLNEAAQHDLELLAFFTLALFAGIRPYGELQKLKWGNVSLEDKMVTIPAHISKTRKRTRHIELSDNAIAWLRLTGEHHPNQKVLKSDYFQLNERKNALWERVGEGKKWIHQGMRHTFCSMWLNAYHDQNKLQRMSGHATPEMLDEYLRGGTQAEALKFWQIMPPLS